jgi:hypothetical protein
MPITNSIWSWSHPDRGPTRTNQPISGPMCALHVGLLRRANGSLDPRNLAEASDKPRRSVEIPVLSSFLKNLSGHVRLPRSKENFRSLISVVSLLTLPACTAWQTQENTLDQISTLQDMRYAQVLTNLSNAIDRSNEIDQRDPIPSQGVASSGTATNVATGSLAFTFTQPFDFAHNTKTFTPMAMLNSQNNWTITPISDPQDLQNLRSLYGLLYKTDREIAQFIADTLMLFAAKADGSINFSYLNTQLQHCGISTTGIITDPEAAAKSFFGAWNAFPEPSTTTDEQSECYNTYGVLGQPGPVGQKLGQVANSLAGQYGLLYPSKHVVFSSIRNGLSPGCRKYQIANLVDTEKRKFRHDTLFQRWLFWKNSSGGWAPYPPPAEPEWLGKYGNHDFWTTSRACLNDFIVVGINATANSHAAAQNAPKPTGPTSAVPGT